MANPSDGLSHLRNAATAAIDRAFETMDDPTRTKLQAVLGDPERRVSVVVSLPGPHLDICVLPVDPEQPPEIVFSQYSGH